MATKKGHTEIVAILLEMGADLKWSPAEYWGKDYVCDALFFIKIKKE